MVDAALRDAEALGIGERELRDQGYGTEVVGILLDFAFGELRLERVYLHVFDFNARAIHAYEQIVPHSVLYAVFFPLTGLVALADVPTPAGVVRLTAPVTVAQYAASLYAALREASKYGGMVGVHAENDDLITLFQAEAERDGLSGCYAHALTRPDITETEAIARAINLAEAAKGRLYIFHMSTIFPL